MDPSRPYWSQRESKRLGKNVALGFDAPRTHCSEVLKVETSPFTLLFQLN